MQPLAAHDLHAFDPDLLPRLEFDRPDLVAREVPFVETYEFRLGHVPEFFAFRLRDGVLLHPGRDVSRIAIIIAVEKTIRIRESSRPVDL
jgi:hypothetical protein